MSFEIIVCVIFSVGMLTIAGLATELLRRWSLQEERRKRGEIVRAGYLQLRPPAHKHEFDLVRSHIRIMADDSVVLTCIQPGCNAIKQYKPGSLMPMRVQV